MAETTSAKTSLSSSPDHSAVSPQAASHPKRKPDAPGDVSLSRRWLIAGGIGVFGAAMLIWIFGWPAVIALGLLALIGGVYAILIEPRRPVLVRQTFVIPSLPAELDGLRIGQLTDSHIGARGAEENLRWAIAQMQREQPDMIAFTGDFIHEPPTVHRVRILLRDLSAPLGVYAVTGNHDYWESIPALRVALDDCGIPLLMNEHRRITWRGGELWLVGTDDVWDGEPDLDAALAGVPAHGFKLLLAHTPHDAPSAARRGIALQLSGHTHGGHMSLPLLGPFATPRYTDSFVAGRYKVGSMWLYVSRGLSGMSIRLGCRPEATIITLRRGE